MWKKISLVLGMGLLASFWYYTRADWRPALAKVLVPREGLRQIVLWVDGIGWSEIQRLRAEGHFRYFHEPSRVIVPFPTMTNVAAADIFHVDPPPGYEGLYFDRKANRLGGGSTAYLRGRRLQGDFHQLLDYVEPKAFEFLIYVFPERIVRADLRRFLEKLGSDRAPYFLAALKSTDGYSHLKSRERVAAFLEELDKVLSQIYEAYRGEVEIVLFSDHGNNGYRSRRVPLEEILEQEGFRIADRIEGPLDVVVPAFGLVGFAAVYTREENEERLARVLAAREETDFVLYRAGETVVVLGKNGAARLSHQRGRYEYGLVQGDPLRLRAALERLSHEGKVDGEGGSTEADWFQVTRDHVYPDAVRRAVKAVDGFVQNPADVLVSFREGYFYGNRMFDRLVTIEATHGSMLESASTAFYMSTEHEAPPYLRSNELLAYFGRSQAATSASVARPAGR
ncbi:MAG: alkaline phosphatase family protein [Acidobacteria bacterium]|nr:alkaline phosphatase family protein [Acidobacteriota bacterium]